MRMRNKIFAFFGVGMHSKANKESFLYEAINIFSFLFLSRPVLYLPGKEISIAVRFSPIKYELRPVLRNDKNVAVEDEKPWTKYQTIFALPYRMIYAVATQNTVIFYDTQQAEPFAR